MEERQTRYSSPVLGDLIGRLKRIQDLDTMTKEDADELLTGAMVMNVAFWQASGESGNMESLMRILRYRIDIVLKMLDSQIEDYN